MRRRARVAIRSPIVTKKLIFCASGFWKKDLEVRRSEISFISTPTAAHKKHNMQFPGSITIAACWRLNPLMLVMKFLTDTGINKELKITPSLIGFCRHSSRSIWYGSKSWNLLRTESLKYLFTIKKSDIPAKYAPRKDIIQEAKRSFMIIAWIMLK